MLNKQYSTTRLVTKELPKIINNPEDKFKTVLFLPKGKNRIGEGGLRTKGYYKKSYDDNPLISIITVVFNGEKHLEETILSIINQTYSNVEYIIIDGGSTDGTLDIIKKYEDKIDYWMAEKDSGIYDAMNKGIEIANGEWINFMNAGDSFFNNLILDKLFNQITYNDIDIIYGSIVNHFGNELLPKKLNELNFAIVTPICHQAIFYASKVIKIHKYNLAYKIVADYEQMLRFFKINKIFLNSKIIIAKFDKPGISANYFWLTWEERFSILIKYNLKYLPIFVIFFVKALFGNLIRKTKLYFIDYWCNR